MRRLVNCALLAITILSSSLVEAQPQRAVDAHFFRPALFSGGIFAIDRAAPLTKWQPSFKFFFNHEGTPLRLTFPQSPCPKSGCIGEQAIVNHAQVFNLQAQMSIASWLEIALDVPLIHYTLASNPAEDTDEGFEILSKSDLKSNVGAPNVSPLDVRLGLKFSVLSWKGLNLALAIQGTLPFGDEEYFAGESGFTLHPRLLSSFDWRNLSIAVNAGYRIREQSTVLWDDPDTILEPELPLLSVDDELTFGVGAVYKIHRVIGIGAEVFGAVPMTSGSMDVESKKIEYQDASSCPTGKKLPCEIVSTRNIENPGTVVMEVLGGVIITPKAGLDIAVGAGAGVLGDARRVALRIFGGISWAPGAVEPTLGAQDRDRDGIPDAKDQCPGRAEDKDGYKDEDGCPDPDNDGDGIPDGKDGCPTETEDKDGYKDDDGCPDLDNDGDGVPDSQDSCPDKPEDKDKFQDADGCPESDNDGDNIADAQDRCPNEPETINNFQDEDGCPDSAPTGVAIGKGKITIPEQIRFKRGNATIAPVSYKLLNDTAKKIRANPQVGRIRIEGHCDNTGTAAANQTLSQARADSVRTYLVNKGVKGDRLQAVGYGSTRNIAPNTTPAGRAKNRRVEFIVVQKKGAQP
jgi:large repetitive protein